MEIRKMNSSDLVQVMEIENGSFTDPWPQVTISDELVNPIAQCLVLEEDSRILGFIVFWMVSDELHILDVAVHPDQRGRGIGRILTTRALDQGLERGLRYAILEVRESNLVAQNLYRSLGFEPVGRRAKYYSDNNEDALLMQVLFADRRANAIC